MLGWLLLIASWAWYFKKVKPYIRELEEQAVSDRERWERAVRKELLK